MNLINGLIILGCGTLFSIISFFFKNSIFKKLDLIFNKVDDLEKEVLRNYVTKEDFKENVYSHEKLWTEINNTKQRIAKLER